MSEIRDKQINAFVDTLSQAVENHTVPIPVEFIVQALCMVAASLNSIDESLRSIAGGDDDLPDVGAGPSPSPPEVAGVGGRPAGYESAVRPPVSPSLDEVPSSSSGTPPPA